MRYRARLWRNRSESGLSAIEVVVAAAVLGASVAVLGPVMTSTLRSERVVSNESRAIDGIRLAVARLDRELRSACAVTAPARDTSGSSLTFRTRAGRAGTYEVTYAVSQGRLERRTAAGTEPLGTGLVATSREFTYTENDTGTRAQIDIWLQVRFEEGHSPRAVRTTIAGRNTWSGCG